MENRSSKKFFCYRIPRSRLIFDHASLIFAICSLALCAIAFGPRLSAYLVLDPVAYGGSDYGAENAAPAPSHDPAYACAYPAHCVLLSILILSL